jgi:hypothetical protein
MKKLFQTYVLFIITIISANGQIIEKNDLYTVIYSEAYQQPLSLSYEYSCPNSFSYEITKYESVPFEISKQQLIEKVEVSYPEVTNIEIIEKRTQSWQKPTGIFTSDKEDYIENSYDRGHLAPNKSFEDEEDLTNFLWSYLNCALMHETLNSGVWRILEDYERELSKTEKVKVTIILSFSDDSEITKGGATAPTHFTKIIEYGFLPDNALRLTNKINIQREVYTFPNNKSVKKKKIETFKIDHLSGEFTTYEK